MSEHWLYTGGRSYLVTGDDGGEFDDIVAADRRRWWRCRVNRSSPASRGPPCRPASPTRMW